MWRALLFVSLLLAGIGAYMYVFERARLDRILDGTPLELPVTVTEVYKWRDQQGRWHITDQPPPTGVHFETMKYRSDDNIMPLVPHE